MSVLIATAVDRRRWYDFMPTRITWPFSETPLRLPSERPSPDDLETPLPPGALVLPSETLAIPLHQPRQSLYSFLLQLLLLLLLQVHLLSLIQLPGVVWTAIILSPLYTYTSMTYVSECARKSA